MKTLSLLIILLFAGIAVGQTDFVYWYNISYALLSEIEPGVFPETGYRIATGSRSQQTEAINDGFAVGNGPADNAGWCGFFWTQAFKADVWTHQPIDTAIISGEFRNGVSGQAQCNPGTVYLKIGVVDFQKTLARYGGAANIPSTAVWGDSSNLLRYNMGFDSLSITLMAQEMVRFEIPSASLDSQFFSIPVVNQVRWIADNHAYGEYAIVFLTDIGSGSPGKATLYAQENGVLPTPGSAHHWTTDGNTVHLVVGGFAASGNESPKANSSGLSISASPNPFRPSTRLSYSLDKTGLTTLDVYDVRGQRVARIVNQSQSAGQYSVDFNAHALAGGVYVCRLTTGNRILTHRIMLIR